MTLKLGQEKVDSILYRSIIQSRRYFNGSVEDTVDFFLTKIQSHEGIFEGIMILQSWYFSPVPIYAARLLSAVCPPARSDRAKLVAFPGSYLNKPLSNLADFSMDL